METKHKDWTLGDLKNFLSELSDEQLKQPIRLGKDDEPVFCIFPFIMQEDLYYNVNEHEDCGTIAELIEIWGDEFDIEDYQISFPKGTVLFDEEY